MKWYECFACAKKNKIKSLFTKYLNFRIDLRHTLKREPWHKKQKQKNKHASRPLCQNLQTSLLQRLCVLCNSVCVPRSSSSAVNSRIWKPCTVSRDWPSTDQLIINEIHCQWFQNQLLLNLNRALKKKKNST